MLEHLKAKATAAEHPVLPESRAAPIARGFEALVYKASLGIEDIYDLTYIRQDGSRFPAVVSVTALRDAQGTVMGYLLIGTDNTARKQAEAVLQQAGAELERLRAAVALRASEQQYRTLFESIDEGFCIIEKMGDGASEPLDFRYIEANPAFAEQSGIGAVVGKTLRQVIPDEFEEWLVTFDTVLKTGESIKFEHGLANQGRVLEVHAFRVEDDTHRRVAINFKDITQRRQTEEQLHQNRDTFFNLVENAPFGVYVVDAQFRMCKASAISLNVFSSARPLIGRDFKEIVRTIWTDPFASEVLARFRHTLETGEPYVAPSTAELRKDIPDVESYDWKIHRITLPDGQLGVVCYFHDITERKLAEDALRESEAFSRSIIKSSPDCIKVLDLEGNLLSMENGQALLCIEDIQPFLNKSWIEFWHGEHRRAARVALALAVTGETGRFVGFFPTLRGEPRWWDVSISPILDAQAHPARLLAVSRDVTARRQAEMNFEFMASVGQDLVRWASVDEMMRTVGAKMGAYFQLSLCAFVEIDEMAEQAMISHDWHRDDVPSLIGVYRLADFVEGKFIQAARAGEVLVVRDVAADSRTDPAKFAPLKISSFLCAPLLRDGQWRFALALYKDAAYDWRADEVELARELITRIWTRLEGLRAEAALRESEERFRAFVTASSDVMYRMSADWVEMRHLDGRNFIADTNKPNSNWLQEYIFPEDQPQVLVAINESIRTKGVFYLEHRVRRVDGSLGWTSSRAVPLLNARDEIVEWFGAASDVTERKQLELNLNNAMAAAEKANLAKSDFLSNMSHELRTPLNAILGFAQLMQTDSQPLTLNQQRSLDQILKGGWYLLELINEVLDLALIESGKLLLSMEPISLTEILRECHAMIEPQAQEHNISLAFPQFEVSYFVKADRKRVKQILINLLSNAIKYNKLGGTVVVDCTASSADRIHVSVKDSGEGLPADKLAQLFQPFNRLGKETGIEEGTGIGLVVCKRLVELMGGIIGVESWVGVGSVFWVELNASAESQPTASATAVAQAHVHADAPLHTLLYVEDNTANLMLIEELIASRPDIRLLTARDGTRGIEIARAYLPDVILMDINLPGVSGIQALRALVEDPTTAHIPVMALSANAMPRDIEKGLAVGFFRYLTKPIRFNEFMDTLDVALKFSKTQSDRATKEGKGLMFSAPDILQTNETVR